MIIHCQHLNFKMGQTLPKISLLKMRSLTVFSQHAVLKSIRSDQSEIILSTSIFSLRRFHSRYDMALEPTDTRHLAHQHCCPPPDRERLSCLLVSAQQERFL